MKTQASVLVKVKELREQGAEAALAAARSALDEATQARDAKSLELQQYRQWRSERERELYQTVTGQTVSLQDIEELNAKVASLRDHERDLVDELADCERALEEREAARQQADLACQQAEREVLKMTDLESRLSGSEARQAERKSEIELEEFSRKSDPMER